MLNINQMCDKAAEEVREAEEYLQKEGFGDLGLIEDDAMNDLKVGYNRHRGTYRIMVNDGLAVRPWTELTRELKLKSFPLISRLVTKMQLAASEVGIKIESEFLEEIAKLRKVIDK